MFALGREKLYKYHIENVSLTHFEGWAMHKNHRNPCRVVIKSTDLKVVADGVTSIERPDLGNRPCGFRLPVKGDLKSLIPGRFLVFVDGVKVANCHVVLPISGNVLDRELEARREALVDLRTERLEREVETLTRRLAELESKAETAA